MLFTSFYDTVNILHYTVSNGMVGLEKDEAKRPTNV